MAEFFKIGMVPINDEIEIDTQWVNLDHISSFSKKKRLLYCAIESDGYYTLTPESAQELEEYLYITKGGGK